MQRQRGYVDYAPTRKDKTPLMRAAIYNPDTLIMQELLQRGAGAQARGKLTGATALEYAKQRESKNAVTLLEKAMNDSR